MTYNVPIEFITHVVLNILITEFNNTIQQYAIMLEK